MLTAKDLLYAALSYDGIWNSSKKMRSSEPAKARRLQLESLLHAFRISRKNAVSDSQIPIQSNGNSTITKTIYSNSNGTNPQERLKYIATLSDLQYLTTGEFIADTDVKRYQDIQNKLKQQLNTSFPTGIKNVAQNSIHLVRVFSGLYSFRHMCYSMLESNFMTLTNLQDSVFEDQYINYIKQEYKKKAPGYFLELDNILCMIIDPENRSFSEESINYPKFDLVSLDREWSKWQR